MSKSSFELWRCDCCGSRFKDCAEWSLHCDSIDHKINYASQLCDVVITKANDQKVLAVELKGLFEELIKEVRR